MAKGKVTQEEKLRFRISGCLTDQCKQELVGVKVEAWDKDTYSRDDFLGYGVTDEQGCFEIEFDESFYKDDARYGTWAKDSFWSGDKLVIFFSLRYQDKDIDADKFSITTWDKKEKDNLIIFDAAFKVDLPESEGTITGLLFYDTSSDVIHQQAKDPPLPGIEVKLQPMESNQWPAPDPVKTDQAGRFTFTVCPGEWLVMLDEEIKPAGQPRLKLSEPRFASIEVNLAAGQKVDLGKIGYEVQGGFVRGIIFSDQDGTGTPNKNPRLTGVPVTLLNPSRGTAMETVTNKQGVYYFASPEPGTYLLHFQSTLDGAKHGGSEGSLKLPSKLPPPFSLAPGEEKQHNLGYKAVGSSVYGLVFLDKDGSGRRSGNEEGISGVPVVLTNKERSLIRAEMSGDTGEYWIEDIPPGSYTVRFSDVFNDKDGNEFILTTAPEQEVIVKVGETTTAAPTGYQPEVHEIRGRVIFENGEGVPGVVVTLKGPGSHEETAVTDKEGYYIFRDRRGSFTLTFADSPYASELLTPHTREIEVQSIARVPDTIYRLGPGGGIAGGALIGSTQESLADIATYMPTSSEVSGPVGRNGAYRGAEKTSMPLQQLVDGALATVLGRRVKTDDVKAFRESLDRAFQIERINGKTEITWMPRVYVVQTELGGAITGAQASLYRRAKAALDDALPLLDGLKPLTASPDEQEVQAARSIVRTEFTELVNELGLEGGPRPQRVDDIFNLLRQQLDRLEVVFGLSRDNVITVDEEQNLTDFLVIEDYVIGLQTTWTQFRTQFRDTKFLGTQLVLLERALSSVGESVEETYRVMDSVFLGPAERQTVRIIFNQPLPGETEPPAPLFVEELLSWVSRFATVESPALIQDGGKRGVETIQQIALRLRQLVVAATKVKVDHVGFSRNRVRRSLEELASQIGLVEQLAQELGFKRERTGN